MGEANGYMKNYNVFPKYQTQSIPLALYFVKFSSEIRLLLSIIALSLY